MSLLIFGLGSNLGKKAENLNLAIKLLIHCFGQSLAIANVYSSKALVKETSPDYFKNLSYLNTAIAFNSSLNPQLILEKIKNIEFKMGRENSEKWSPRIIDIDILIYQGYDCNFSNIQIPHTEIAKRDFVLLPLIDIFKELKMTQEVEKYSKFVSNLESKTAIIAGL